MDLSTKQLDVFFLQNLNKKFFICRVKGKRTPKKKPNPRSTSETVFADAEGKGVSDLSDADPTTSKDYVESGEIMSSY